MDIGKPNTLLLAIQELLAMGEPLEEVLPVFTSNVAEVMALPRKGVIAVGADADVVSLSESGELGMVMANGEVMVRDGKACKHGVFELAL